MAKRHYLAAGIGWIALTAALAGCALFNAPPTAIFSATPTSGPSPLTVALNAAASSDSGGRIVTYDWSFGDGHTGSGASTSHTYTMEGTFTVVLTVTDNYGATDTETADIEVLAPLNDPPTAAFTAAPTAGTPPLTVQFNAGASSDPDGTIDSYAWDFGDGSTGTGLTVTHTYTSAGVFVVLLTVTDDGGSTDTTDQSITVTAPGNDAPTAAFSFSGGMGFILPITVEFDATASYDDDGTIVAYSWNFGDGEYGGGSKVSHAYDAYGTYTVVLIVVDNDGAIGSRSRDVKIRFPLIPI